MADCLKGHETGSGAKAVSNCIASGRSCWHQRVASFASANQTLHPLAIHESVDFLDAVWHLLFGSALVKSTTATNTASLSQPAANLADLRTRLGALKDVLDGLRPADDLLPPFGLDGKAIQGALNRVKAAVTNRFGDVPAAIDAVTRIQKVFQLRDKFEHGKGMRELPRRFTELGIQSDLSEPGALWEEIRSITTTALIDLRNAIRSAPEFAATTRN